MKKVNKIILQACIFQGWDKFITGMLIPILVLFQLDRGLSLLQIGFNMAIFSGTVILLEIPSGFFADYFGNKKVYLLSILLNILSMAFLMFTKESVWITIAFSLWGSGRAFSSGSMEAIFINKVSVTESHRSVERLISYTEFTIPVSLALGALLGGFLPDLKVIKIALISLSDFYSINFFTAFSLYLGLSVFFSIYVSDSIDIKEKSSDEYAKIKADKNSDRKPDNVLSLAFSTIKNSSVFLIIMLTSLAWGFAFSGLETFWQPRVFTITGGIESTVIYGLLTTGYFLAGALGSLLSWPICRLLGNKPYIFLFSQRLFLGGMLFILSCISGLGWFSTVYIGLLFFNGMSNPVEQSVLNRNIPSDSRATLLSVISFLMQAGGLTGALIGGVLSEIKGIPFTWQIGAFVLIISSFPYLLANKKDKINKN